MQISKFMLVVCAATCAAVVTAQGADNAAQAKARAALEQKLKETEGQAPAAPAQPAATATSAATEVPVVVIPPPATAAAPVAQPAMQARTGDSEAIARAREALRKRMSELHAQEPTQATPPAVVPAVVAAPVPVKAVASPAPVAVVPQVQPAFAPAIVATPAADSEAIARAREALRQKMAEVHGQPQPPVVSPAPAVVATPAPAATVPAAVEASAVPTVQPAFDTGIVAAPGADPAAVAKAQAALRQKMSQLEAQQPVAPLPAKLPKSGQLVVLGNAPGFKPLSGPELPASITPVKQQRLADLLTRYKADQVTPEEYHTERAKILAEP